MRLSYLLAAAAVSTMPLAASAQDSAQFRSTIDDLRITALQTLPQAPQGSALPERCSHWLVTPETVGGRLAAAAGWGVTGEVAVGKYHVASFVGTLTPGTSGACPAGDGNVGIFESERLVALVYVPRGSSKAIGSVEPLETDGVRIWDGDYLRQPLADLRLGADGALTVGPLAAEEKICGGKAGAPNIYGKPITQARALLAEAGWAAVAAQEPSREFSREKDLIASGLLELEACSGTGFGFCLFNYQGPAGKLSVTTVGEDDPPVVSGYGVTCSN